MPSSASTAARGAGLAAAASASAAVAAATAGSATCHCALGGGGVGGGEEGGGGGWRIEPCSRSGAAAQFGEGIFFFLNLACSDVGYRRVGRENCCLYLLPLLISVERERGLSLVRCAGHGGWG